MYRSKHDFTVIPEPNEPRSQNLLGGSSLRAQPRSSLEGLFRPQHVIFGGRSKWAVWTALKQGSHHIFWEIHGLQSSSSLIAGSESHQASAPDPAEACRDCVGGCCLDRSHCQRQARGARHYHSWLYWVECFVCSCVLLLLAFGCSSPKAPTKTFTHSRTYSEALCHFAVTTPSRRLSQGR